KRIILFIISIIIITTLSAQQRIAILIPDGKGLSEEQDYLRFIVQQSIVSDFNKHTDYGIVDLQTLEKVLQHAESEIYTSDANYVRLGQLASVDFTLTGTITKNIIRFFASAQHSKH
ncbi:MAG: hypothetical protein FWG20_05650, partial [Candidatus Cloacimonetes bacterium]|nr:hypothetical protein [Candidatus Cloacimonadota bacterium]